MRTIAWIIVIVSLLVISPVLVVSLGIALPIIGLVLLILLPGILIGFAAAKKGDKEKK